MKKIFSLLFVIIIISGYSTVYSQKITAGISSGINISDIHGQDNFGRWGFKPGPVENFSLGYSFNKIIGFQTGISYSSVIYDHKIASYPYEYYPYSLYSSYVAPLSGSNEMMQFSFIRIPLLLNVTIPSDLKLTMRAGIFFSFISDFSMNTSYYYSYGNLEPEKNDFGYVFSSGLSYPLSDKLNLIANVGYLTGKRKFLENTDFRHGSSEFTLGLEYDFLKGKKAKESSSERDDSLQKNIFITYRYGLNISWIKNYPEDGHYSNYVGSSLGFSINVPLGADCYVISGFTFERKGYSLVDSSSLFYRHMDYGYQMYYVDSKLEIDYGIIPLLISLHLSKNDRLHLSTGPWVGLKLNARNIGVAYDELRSQSGYYSRKTLIYDDVEQTIRDNDFGWIFGCDASLPIFNSYKLNLAVQYSTGFKDVYNKEANGDTQNSSYGNHVIRNRTISFILGVTIPSKGNNK